MIKIPIKICAKAQIIQMVSQNRWHHSYRFIHLDTIENQALNAAVKPRKEDKRIRNHHGTELSAGPGLVFMQF